MENMALLIHQMQGSHVACPVKLPPWTKGVKLKPFVAVKLIGRKVGYNSMKSCFRLSDQRLHWPHRKPLKISSFKGNAKNAESEGRDEDSKSPTASIKLSYTSQERVETIYTDTENLFKKWLIMLRTQTFSQTTYGIFRENQLENQDRENQSKARQWKMSKLMNATLSYFLRLDAAIKFPLIIFVPFYLAINIVYGAAVAKELTPMWVLGPLIISFYIMAIKGLYCLYVLTFKKTVSLVKSIPVMGLSIHDYVAGGKLGAELKVRFWQPLADIKNMDSKELFKKKGKEVEDLMVEKYLDFVESIWPYYCRTIRFLKKARLI